MQIAQTALDPLPVPARWDTLEMDAYAQVRYLNLNNNRKPHLFGLLVACLVFLLKLLVF